MKTTIDGKRYDSERCETLASYSHYNNGVYSGTSSLMLAKDGTFLTMTRCNGQDLYMRNVMTKCNDPVGWLEDIDLTEEQEEKLVRLRLITLV